MVHSGYIRADAVPTKYSETKPETVLKSAGVLTAGVVDPAALQCASADAPHLGAFVSWVVNDAADGLKGASLDTLKSSEVQDAEKAVNNGKALVGPVTARTAGLTEAQVVEAAWTYVATPFVPAVHTSCLRASRTPRSCASRAHAGFITRARRASTLPQSRCTCPIQACSCT